MPEDPSSTLTQGTLTQIPDRAPMMFKPQTPTRTVVLGLAALALISFAVPFAVGLFPRKHRSQSPTFTVMKAVGHHEQLNQRGMMLSMLIPERQWDPRAWVRVLRGPQRSPTDPGTLIAPEDVARVDTAVKIMARDRWTIVLWYSSNPEHPSPLVLVPLATMTDPQSTQAELLLPFVAGNPIITLPRPD